MRCPGRMVLLTAVAACLVGYTAAGQSTPPSQNQQNQTTQDQNQDQYTGVSHPPADETIRADEDLATPAPAANPASSPVPVPVAKPSAALPAPVMQPTAATKNAGNSDYGMVGDDNVSLEKRGDNSDDDIVSYVPDNPNELAEGTNIRVALTEELSTADTPRGAAFEAKLTGNVYKDGRVIIPAGSVMRGRVVSVAQGHHVGPHATIRLRPESVVLPDGTEYRLMAEVVESEASGTRVNEEGTIVASTRYRKDAAEYGAGAGAGAAVGALVAGPVGAGVGTVVGTGAVSAHMLTSRPEAAKLPEGSVLIFSLTEPLEFTASKNQAAP